MFIKHGATGGLTAPIAYVDGILITGSDVDERHLLSTALALQFEMKALGTPKYVLGIEVAILMLVFLSANIFLVFSRRLACLAAC